MRLTCSYLFIFSLALLFVGCSTPTTSDTTDDEDTYFQEHGSLPGNSNSSSDKNQNSIYNAVVSSGRYTTRDSVAAYLCKFNVLPQNYVGKNQGQKLYESYTGNTFSKWNFNPWKTLGVMIGGDTFNNREGLLTSGTYHEADVDYGNVQSRGTKRLVYQSGCIIYYTADHYETFKKLDVVR